LEAYCGREPSPDFRRLMRMDKQQPVWQRVVAGIFQFGSSLVRALTAGYRPELHYMRGPGPKWRAKHGQI
jgi:hypothetical protein